MSVFASSDVFAVALPYALIGAAVGALAGLANLLVSRDAREARLGVIVGSSVAGFLIVYLAWLLWIAFWSGATD